jgi:signal transduction histidine kinase
MGQVLSAAGPFGAIVRFASVIVAVGIILALARTGGGMRRSSTVLDRMSEVAARVEAGDYSARVGTSAGTPGAVRDLARRFDTMVARLEADERQRRRLLADVTHELRTPLAVVQGSVEAILDGVHPADTEHLGTILDETHVLARLIDDLRTLALSEAGSLSLHREPTDLAILAAEVATAFAATAEAAGVVIETTVDEGVPLLDVDPVRIREVLSNLVANAVRHTPLGGRVAVAATIVTGNEVEMTVRDTGSGIAPELLPHVFERFTRGEGSTGTGLGLAIARGLVELHGGTISAAAAPGGGTEIRVRLPVDAD